MADLRIYAGTSGDCIAGDRHADYADEKRRVQADFISGVRLALDERRREIRGFVPAHRGSGEAFYAVMSAPEGTLDTGSFVGRIRDLFDRVEGWSIRSGTPEGELLASLGSDPPARTALGVPVAKLRDGHRAHVGVPEFGVATRELAATRAILDTDTIRRLYVISITRILDHLDEDLLLHASRDYEGVELLDVWDDSA